MPFLPFSAPPVPEAALADAEAALGMALPPGYRAFLAQSDGYDGPIGEGPDVALWPLAEVVAATTGDDGAPELGLVLIGSNGGPTAFGFDDAGHFVSVPFLVMEPSGVRTLGLSWDEFLIALAAGDGW